VDVPKSPQEVDVECSNCGENRGPHAIKWEDGPQLVPEGQGRAFLGGPDIGAPGTPYSRAMRRTGLRGPFRPWVSGRWNWYTGEFLTVFDCGGRRPDGSKCRHHAVYRPRTLARMIQSTNGTIRL
jgi:hypothetical protein